MFLSPLGLGPASAGPTRTRQTNPATPTVTTSWPDRRPGRRRRATKERSRLRIGTGRRNQATSSISRSPEPRPAGPGSTSPSPPGSGLVASCSCCGDSGADGATMPRTASLASGVLVTAVRPSLRGIGLRPMGAQEGRWVVATVFRQDGESGSGGVMSTSNPAHSHARISLSRTRGR